MPDPDLIHFCPAIPVELQGRVLSAPHFVRWRDGLLARFDVRRIDVRDVVMFGTRVGFILAVADAYSDGRPVPGAAMLRGDSVSILLVLQCPGEAPRTVLTREARVPIARPDLLALPAGMLDGGEFVSTALRELSEEVGADLKVRQADLVLLDTVWLSPGGTDEAIALYYAEIPVSPEVLHALEGRHTGLSSEHENIHLHVLPLADLPAIGRTDAKTLLSYHLYMARGDRKDKAV
ncbi:NUDIX domain-containing protein [Gluconacetobacter entanii]|uniref:GDP-mannose pyrophosphatase n=1 Tax=Gluconacetobacter entanii TaxID=108528 RepID=A0A318Q8W3_9PROT|nr:NUDIX domain-containing protein [Gluconacetobacter entanii]MCE2578099.1 NUDIX domain-containing protein [Komagataeibacter sp. FNDCR1]PYD62297.1 nucleoside diphosphate hydrolase [Gluconacetobacter entanii]